MRETDKLLIGFVILYTVIVLFIWGLVILLGWLTRKAMAKYRQIHGEHVRRWTPHV